MSSYVEIRPLQCEVIGASEYALPRHDSPMHPVVRFSDGKHSYHINDRYVLYSFLKVLDPELEYLDMMQSIYDTPIGERPSLDIIIQGYLGYSEPPHLRMGLWVENTEINKSREILSVEDGNTNSEYFDTTMEYIRANFLPEHNTSIRHMIKGKNKYPVMVFSKGNTKIEIMSYKQKTFIAGRYKNRYQPRPVGFCPRWSHLIPHDILSIMLDDYRILDSMDELTKDSIIVGGGGASERLKHWAERNALERDNMYRFDRKTIQAINSFCNVEE
jgi:hypothetical protein